MSSERVTRAPIVTQGLPETLCFKSFKDFFAQLGKYAFVDIPEDITNVVVSNIQPTSSQLQSVWFRLSNGGTFIGIYIYSQGQWNQIAPTPNGIMRMYGDSRNIPPGFSLIEVGTTGFTSAMVSFLHTQWLRDPSDQYWQIFDTIYEGL